MVSSEVRFAGPMNRVPKAVFSRTGTSGHPGTTRGLEDARAQALPVGKPETEALESWRSARTIVGDLFDGIMRLKREPEKDIFAHGGATFAQNLVSLGVVDEYRLRVHPVALARGLPLFSLLAAPADLELVEIKAFKGSAAAHVYRPKAADSHPTRGA